MISGDSLILTLIQVILHFLLLAQLLRLFMSCLVAVSSVPALLAHNQAVLCGPTLSSLSGAERAKMLPVNLWSARLPGIGRLVMTKGQSWGALLQ